MYVLSHYMFKRSDDVYAYRAAQENIYIYIYIYICIHICIYIYIIREAKGQAEEEAREEASEAAAGQREEPEIEVIRQKIRSEKRKEVIRQRNEIEVIRL